MRHVAMLVLVLMGSALMSGCAYRATDATELGEVADRVGMVNITTGDGTFADYKAVDYHHGDEIGIAIGIPFLWKIFEIWPAQTNEDLVEEMARTSKAHGADAMINVNGVRECYMGFPFFIIGIYVDHVEGTGIDLK